MLLAAGVVLVASRGLDLGVYSPAPTPGPQPGLGRLLYPLVGRGARGGQTQPGRPARMGQGPRRERSRAARLRPAATCRAASGTRSRSAGCSWPPSPGRYQGETIVLRHLGQAYLLRHLLHPQRRAWACSFPDPAPLHAPGARAGSAARLCPAPARLPRRGRHCPAALSRGRPGPGTRCPAMLAPRAAALLRAQRTAAPPSRAVPCASRSWPTRALNAPGLRACSKTSRPARSPREPARSTGAFVRRAR